MNGETLQRIVELFYGERANGTGMGLAIVHGNLIAISETIGPRPPSIPTPPSHSFFQKPAS